MTHPVDQHVGNKLKQARRLRKLSQTDIARKVDLSFQQVQKYETGANRISASRLFEFAEILNVSPGFFFEGLQEEETQNDPGMDIVSAIASITDDKIKDRVVTFINDVSGATVAQHKQ